MDYFENLGDTLSARLGTWVPDIIGALLVLIVGFILASLLRRLTIAGLKRTNLDERIGNQTGASFRVDKFVAQLVYFLVLLFTLLIVLSMMGAEGVLRPVTDLLGDFLSAIPRIIMALIIGFVGYMVAKLVSQATGFITAYLQRLTTRAGVNLNFDLGQLVRSVVFILVFIPILIAALDVLEMEVITRPATELFRDFLSFIPAVLAAALILAVFYIAGKFITGLLQNLLHNLGIDRFSASLGGTGLVRGETGLSTLISNIVFFFIIFAGVIAAMERLAFPQVTNILNDLLEVSGRIVFGLIILVIVNFLANMAKNMVSRSEGSDWLGQLARYVVLFLFLAIGLDTMGIGEDVVNLIFGLTIGAVAVAFALSFGLGGREAAGEHMRRFLDKLANRSSEMGSGNSGTTRPGGSDSRLNPPPPPPGSAV